MVDVVWTGSTGSTLLAGDEGTEPNVVDTADDVVDSFSSSFFKSGCKSVDIFVVQF